MADIRDVVSREVTIPAGAIDSYAVTAAKIATYAVQTAKLDTGAVTANDFFDAPRRPRSCRSSGKRHERNLHLGPPRRAQ